MSNDQIKAVSNWNWFINIHIIHLSISSCLSNQQLLKFKGFSVFCVCVSVSGRCKFRCHPKYLIFACVVNVNLICSLHFCINQRIKYCFSCLFVCKKRCFCASESGDVGDDLVGVSDGWVGEETVSYLVTREQIPHRLLWYEGPFSATMTKTIPSVWTSLFPVTGRPSATGSSAGKHKS